MNHGVIMAFKSLMPNRLLKMQVKPDGRDGRLVQKLGFKPQEMNKIS
jgi:hypothetical protein